MIPTPGTSEHLLALIRQYAQYQDMVRAHLPGLSAAHTEDIAAALAKASPDLPAEVTAMAPDAAVARIRAEIQALLKSDPFLADPPPLGQYLLRLFLTASPWHDRAQIASTIDRMDVDGKRRLAVGIKRKLQSENKSIPEPRDTDGNIATAPRGHAPPTPHRRFREQRGSIGGGQPIAHDAAPIDADDRDVQRPQNMQLQPMRKRIVRA